MTTPVFAVVGHPNKGKSSLVATLSRDTSVRISPEPGTTTQARRFAMQLNSQTLYTLVDTPGFQRARAALAWMQEHATDAAARPAAVKAFVNTHHNDPKFADECELLAPIVNEQQPAAILYVVDGAKPYGPEYDPEMQLLRWTGRPSMAVINPIGQANYADQWRDALSQFFKVVRVLDAVHAPFDQQISLLRAFGELDESWRSPMDRAVAALQDDRQRKQDAAARAIAEMLTEALTWQAEKKLGHDEDPTPHRPKLEETYRGGLRKIERAGRNAVEAIYDHSGLDRGEPALEALERDLWHEDTWLAFGLRRRDLIAAGAASGAIAGGVIDASLLGTSFLTGTIIGAAVGGAAGYLSAGKLAEAKVLHLPLGGRVLRYGPAKDPNVPFVLLGRARLHHAAVAGRTHAQRGRLEIPTTQTQQSALNELSANQRKSLAAAFNTARKAKPGSPAAIESLDRLTLAVRQTLAD